ncbi:hypothetical protein NPIL_560531 [Nephila pilipes]|uniref:Uncharacterized protein n=1 Tax=Nephila pilipes TaxID=299642 RepID=A0A8X6N4G4_NEPPI|nr:hypothetical protein NPIL_560531 [Nephila pilipes]
MIPGGMLPLPIDLTTSFKATVLLTTTSRRLLDVPLQGKRSLPYNEQPCFEMFLLLLTVILDKQDSTYLPSKLGMFSEM